MSNFFKNPRSLCVAIGLALGTTHAGANTQPTQPNILVIMADDMGWSDIAPYGGEIDTPYLSELAKEGVSFTNFFVSPFSSPSRAMFLTGADPHEVGLGNENGETKKGLVLPTSLSRRFHRQAVPCF